MKKVLYAVLLVVILLISLVGAAAAAPMKSGTATLVSVVYVPGKGPVFTFNVSGHFSKSDLKGSVHVDGGANYDLSCTQVDESTVKCTASKAIAGTNVVVTWGGSTFWTNVPEFRAADPEYCYGVWDYWDFTDDEWTDFGPHCQDTPAQVGDEILYTVPDPDGSFEFPSWFSNGNDPECDIPDYGPAYYYNWCLYD